MGIYQKLGSGHMRILHVSEAMGGGIVTVTESISRRQTEAGAQVAVWYLDRRETPSPEAMRSRFHEWVELRNFGSRKGLPRLLTEVRRVFKSGEWDVVHLHSTVAGALGRLALIGIRTKVVCFYSPHGFSFLRLNNPRCIRRALEALEKALSRLGDGIILTSRSEFDLAKQKLRSPAAYLLKTGVPSSTIRPRPKRERLGKPVVGMIGRVSFQKAPWVFAAAARALQGQATFVWVGDGTADDVEKWIAHEPVEMTGWVAPDELIALVDTFDIFLFPTLWEGMALSLIQAQAQGVPAVTSTAVGNVDTVRDGFSGFVCDSSDSAIEATRRLVEDRNLREIMGNNAVQWARANLTDDDIGVDSLGIYQGALASRRQAEQS